MTRKTFYNICLELNSDRGYSKIFEQEDPFYRKLSQIIGFFVTAGDLSNREYNEWENKILNLNACLIAIENLYNNVPKLRKSDKYWTNYIPQKFKNPDINLNQSLKNEIGMKALEFSIKKYIEYLKRALPRIEHNGKTYKQHLEDMVKQNPSLYKLIF